MEPIAFSVRECEYCREITPDCAIECTNCGAPAPVYQDLFPKLKDKADEALDPKSP